MFGRRSICLFVLRACLFFFGSWKLVSSLLRACAMSVFLWYDLPCLNDMEVLLCFWLFLLFRCLIVLQSFLMSLLWLKLSRWLSHLLCLSVLIALEILEFNSVIWGSVGLDDLRVSLSVMSFLVSAESWGLKFLICPWGM